jgi:hypothetical protein
MDLSRVMNLARRAIVLALLALGAMAAPSWAGTYDVYSCTLPNGLPAPTDGWSAYTSYGLAVRAQNFCSSRRPYVGAGELYAELYGETGGGGYAGWIFTAPRSTTIGNFTLFRAAHTVNGDDWFHDYMLLYVLRQSVTPETTAEFCTRYGSCDGRGVQGGRPFDPANRISASGIEVQRLYALMSCDLLHSAPKCTPSSDHGHFSIYSARIGLTDPYRPELSRRPSGPLLDSSGPLEGEKSISFSATDRGGGIEKVGLTIDGALRLVRPAIDPAASRCHRPFIALVPCPLGANTTIAFDTATLPNGPHSVQASVIDAAGNETRSDPVVVTTRNGSRPNGRGASRFVKLAAWLRSRRTKQRASAVVPYGSVRTADGRLTDAEGKPIGGAVLDVVSNVDRPGAKDKRAGSVTTRDDGRFSYRIARGPSRELRFEYRAYTLDPAPVSSAKVTLGVRAGFRLRLGPRKVRNGQRVVFRGQLKGGPARKGARVTIDVLVPDARRRVPIGNVKADARGRFRFSYRFRRTLVVARYRFQARLVAQPGYPYRGATSRRVSVVVRP